MNFRWLLDARAGRPAIGVRRAPGAVYDSLHVHLVHAAWCLLPLAAGMGAALALLVAAGAPVRRVQAVAPAAAAAVLFYPGCSPTIQACLLTATAGSTLVIQPGTYITSFTLNNAVSVTGANRNTTILQALTGQRVITVDGAAVNNNVVISGLTIRGGLSSGLSCPSGCGGGIYIANGAQPRLANLLILNNSAGFQGGGIYAVGDLNLNDVVLVNNTSAAAGGGVLVTATLGINGGLFQGNRCTQADCGGGGLLTGGALTTTGTRFVANVATHFGAGAFAGGPANIKGGSFEGNSCTETICAGGGLHANMDLTMASTTFVSNSVGAAGGGVSALGTVTIVAGRFQNNQCSQAGCGGGALLVGSALTVTGTGFISNGSAYHGGGIYAYAGASLTNAVFLANKCSQADCGGGGLYVAGPVELTGTTFMSNTAGIAGGGLAAISTTVVFDSFFQNNRCVQAGCSGGALLAGGAFSVTDVSFLGNRSLSHGGAVYVLTSLSASVDESLFHNNHCTEALCAGGGLYAGGAAALTNTVFLSNAAGLAGGGAIVASGLTVSGGSFEANRCTASDCVGGGLAAANSLALTATQFISNSAAGSGGGLVHTFGNGRLVNALFASNDAPDGGAALYLTSPGDVQLLHTTILGGPFGGTGVTVSTGTVGITNSIIATYTVGISVTTGSARESHNLFFGNGSNALGVAAGGGSLTAAPQFVAPQHGDYHLRRGSPARNLGLGAGVTTDADGDARPPTGGVDAGLDEYIEATPLAGGDAYTLSAGLTLNVSAPLGVLVNDSDPNADTLTALLVSQPAAGTLSLAPDGGFVYTRPSGYSGMVAFTYRAYDGVSSSSPVSVILTLLEIDNSIYLPLIRR